MPFKFCKITRGTIPVDVFILHGYNSSVGRVQWLSDILGAAGYSLVMCEYYGHGGNEGHKKDVFDSMEYIEHVIRSRHRPVVLIGHSMGGAMALSISARVGDPVSQVFAVSSPNGISFMNGYIKSPQLQFIVGKNTTKESVSFVKTMPLLYGSCDRKRSSMYYLIHSESDSVVPVKDCYENAELFCVPDDHMFIKERITGNGMIDHWAIFRHKDTIDVITNNILR